MMRISNTMMTTQGLFDINNALQQMSQTQQDITTGTFIHIPQDDPTAYARAQALKTNLAQNAQYTKNMDAAKNFLDTTDTSLTTVAADMQRLRQLMVQGASGSLQPPDRQAIITEVNQIQQEIQAVGNTQVNGRYIFGGLKTQTQPLPAVLAMAPNDTGTLSVEVAPGVTLPYNTTAVQVFGDTTTTNTLWNIISQFTGFLALNTSNTNISTISLSRMDQWMTQVDNARTTVGALTNRVDISQSRLQDINNNLTTLLGKTQNTDVAKASLELNQSQAAYQAALAITARSVPLSLVDYLH
jgi:flagellar hook-associated protein 3 FlgL